MAVPTKFLKFACLMSLPLSISSCGMLANSAKSVEDKIKSLGEEEEHTQSQGTLKSLSDLKPKVSSSMAALPSEEDIIWAPEDPDAPMEELDDLWENMPKDVDSWHVSYIKAMREAREEGKPVLMWFTDSQRNVATKALANEVFNHKKFKDWADEKVVLLRIDSFIVEDNSDLKERKRQYVRDLKERYKVLGAPVVVMLSPRGTSFGKYTGYKSGSAEFYFGRLRSGYRNAAQDYQRWRQEYERKGYRVWHDYRGRKVFAKPRALRDGELYLITPDGKKSKTSLSKLSAEDQAWVAEQRKKSHN
ncbi:thioredoxin family protein [Rubritalea spongiae]|uniref:Thioredoxin family protein n=1 Tax=Rubritalea spongiae TaxID=430797 RepID=A0ABW5E1U1_9BACT